MVGIAVAWEHVDAQVVNLADVHCSEIARETVKKGALRMCFENVCLCVCLSPVCLCVCVCVRAMKHCKCTDV